MYWNLTTDRKSEARGHFIGWCLKTAINVVGATKATTGSEISCAPELVRARHMHRAISDIRALYGQDFGLERLARECPWTMSDSVSQHGDLCRPGNQFGPA
ncbi:MAG: hypothetical protein O7I42_27150 [Alphaproteobacteria bacterium]|nr:hypothetical protein [Alphaproteobacteria bacterium]